MKISLTVDKVVELMTVKHSAVLITVLQINC